jgi:deoxyribodipyrimidine photo-lyase
VAGYPSSIASFGARAIQHFPSPGLTTNTMPALPSSDPSLPIIVWFRSDLRLSDHAALHAAWLTSQSTGRRVIPLYIREKGPDAPRADGGAARWWLHHSLNALSRDVAEIGAPLVLRTGDALEAIRGLIGETGATEVHWNRRYERAGIEVDTTVKSALKADGIEAVSHRGNVLYEPWSVSNKQGDPCKVFTPFWRAARQTGHPDAPLPRPDKLLAYGEALESEALEDWALLPTKPDWSGGLQADWTPGEAGASQRLETFIDEGLRGYADLRDRPDRPNTSRLSPYLRFGEISPNQIYHRIDHLMASGDTNERDALKFLAEIGWREFSHHLLFHFPSLPQRNLQSRFDEFPWADDDGQFLQWTRGMTGFPIIDAGMRQLWQTGWMHNRVRMIVASFLVKNLLVPWQRGEEWFWDTLVDADHANNAASWQWVAGSGADAAPYFRIFNPLLQGEKFDPEGDFVRAFVPELARLPRKFIHRPWDASEPILREAGIALGETYPHRMVDLAETRNRALLAFKTIKDAPKRIPSDAA